VPVIAVGAEVRGFRIEAELGRGGMGVVYLAEQLSLGRKVALKVMAPDLSADPGFAERFTREARLAASLDHPNVIPVFETGSIDGVLYLAMRYVPGTDLRALLAARGPLSGEQAVAIIQQLAGALDAAHARGLVHRDVKPANVLLADHDPGAHVYLADFGLTKEIESQSGSLTKTGQLVGTLDYVAPEQIEGRAIDARTDTYSLGCVLFQMLAGRVPYQGTEAHKLWAHLSEPPPSLEGPGPPGAARFDAVIQRAMAKDPGERYPSAGDLGRAAAAAAARTQIVVPERSVASGDAAPTVPRVQPAHRPVVPVAPAPPPPAATRSAHLQTTAPSAAVPPPAAAAWAAPTVHRSTRPRSAAWTLVGGVLVAGLAAMAARGWIGKEITSDSGWIGNHLHGDAADIVATVARRGVTWAIVGAALAVFLTARRGGPGRLVASGLVGLLVGFVAGALGGAIFQVPESLANLSSSADTEIKLASITVTGGLMGALIGAFWSPRHIWTGLLVGGAAGALVQLVVHLDQHQTLLAGIQSAVIAGLTFAALLALDARAKSRVAQATPATSRPAAPGTPAQPPHDPTWYGR
jgi:predicted Ser/Thr protein kinase